MNIISIALDNLKYRIPLAVLQETFKDTQNWRRSPASLDELIMVSVIRPRVLVDANLVGGQMANIPLDGLNPEFVDTYTAIYHIPKERTQNRSILSALSVGYMPQSASYNSAGGNYGNVAPQSMTDLTSATQRVADSFSGIPPVSNAYVELVSENTILLRDQFRVTAAYFLRCILGHDEMLNNINPRSYLNFAKLVEHAVKSYIHNTMAIKIDQAYLSGGQNLGVFKEIVDSYSDAEENYQTYLREVWQAVSFMNDTHSHNRLLKLMVNPGL